MKNNHLKHRLTLWTIMLLLVLSAPSMAGELNPRVKQEIDRLLVFVEESGCAFNRNGRWYDSKEAAAHITKKYRYVLKKGMVKSTEDFISLAASQSSMSGRAYTVRCDDSAIIPSSQWLHEALGRIRKQDNTPQ